MELNFTREFEAKLEELSIATGRPAADLLQDAATGYFEEIAQVREMLDARYDDIESGKIKPIDGEEAFARLRRKSAERRAGRA